MSDLASRPEGLTHLSTANWPLSVPEDVFGPGPAMFTGRLLSPVQVAVVSSYFSNK